MSSNINSCRMSRNFLIAAVLVPLVCFLLFKFQDGDFTLMIYEKIGQDPAVALRGKVVWITGASSGIGEYLAYELVKYGCKLVLSARRKAELERVKNNCAGKTRAKWVYTAALYVHLLSFVHLLLPVKATMPWKIIYGLFERFSKKKRVAFPFVFREIF